VKHEERIQLAHAQLGLLARLGPKVLRVLAAALEHNRAHGGLPSAEVVAELAKAEGASVGASLVMVRREIENEDGRAVPLDGDSLAYGHGIVRDVETCIALEIGGRPRIHLRLRREDGRRINPNDLIWTAENWAA
jgi:hypothetical protein